MFAFVPAMLIIAGFELTLGVVMVLGAANWSTLRIYASILHVHSPVHPSFDTQIRSNCCNLLPTSSPCPQTRSSHRRCVTLNLFSPSLSPPSAQLARGLQMLPSAQQPLHRIVDSLSSSTYSEEYPYTREEQFFVNLLCRRHHFETPH